MTRRYDSPLRRARAAETRRRIVTAGAELLHGFPIWHWEALTVKAAAARAGVTERTVYRYFPSERALRDAVMEQLEEDAGVRLDGLRLDDVPAMAARILGYVSEFPLGRSAPLDETLAAAGARQREALAGAVERAAGDWPGPDRAVAAALLDVLWGPAAFQRLVVDWGLPPADAIAGVTWAIGLVQRALAEGELPLGDTPG